MNTSILRNTILYVLCGAAFLFHPRITRAQVPQATPQEPSELFRVAHIWTLHLTFTPAQWDAMEPRGENRGPGGGGPGGFGPGNFIAAAFLRSLDRDKNESINRAEFLDGFDQWFKSWGKGASALTEELLRAGINRDLAPFGPPGGPPPEGDRP